jgi:hypothetical protein
VLVTNGNASTVSVVDTSSNRMSALLIASRKPPAERCPTRTGLVGEIYRIDGSATLVTGSDIVAVKRRPADHRAVRLVSSPGGNGVPIRKGAAYEFKPGDVAVPAGVGHWLTKIDEHLPACYGLHKECKSLGIVPEANRPVTCKSRAIESTFPDEYCLRYGFESYETIRKIVLASTEGHGAGG